MSYFLFDKRGLAPDRAISITLGLKPNDHIDMP